MNVRQLIVDDRQVYCIESLDSMVILLVKHEFLQLEQEQRYLVHWRFSRTKIDPRRIHRLVRFAREEREIDLENSRRKLVLDYEMLIEQQQHENQLWNLYYP